MLPAGILAYQAVARGFPAVASGDLPVWSLKVDRHLPEAFAVIGFAFYMQPMMMPLLQEMPPGRVGTQIMRSAVHWTLYGKSCKQQSNFTCIGIALRHCPLVAGAV